MTIEERAEYAAELKATGQCNCTQAVLKAFEDKLPVNSEELMKLTAGFAAGMGIDWCHRGGRRSDSGQRNTTVFQGDSR